MRKFGPVIFSQIHAAGDKRREIEADLLAIAIAGLPRDGFDAALRQLRKRREDEIEPEARIALGQAIMGAQRRRYPFKH
jgi:hypothetical protein